MPPKKKALQVLRTKIQNDKKQKEKDLVQGYAIPDKEPVLHNLIESWSKINHEEYQSLLANFIQSDNYKALPPLIRRRISDLYVQVPTEYYQTIFKQFLEHEESFGYWLDQWVDEHSDIVAIKIAEDKIRKEELVRDLAEMVGDDNLEFEEDVIEDDDVIMGNRQSEVYTYVDFQIKNNPKYKHIKGYYELTRHLKALRIKLRQLKEIKHPSVSIQQEIGRLNAEIEELQAKRTIMSESTSKDYIATIIELSKQVPEGELNQTRLTQIRPFEYIPHGRTEEEMEEHKRAQEEDPSLPDLEPIKVLPHRQIPSLPRDKPEKKQKVFTAHEYANCTADITKAAWFKQPHLTYIAQVPEAILAKYPQLEDKLTDYKAYAVKPVSGFTPEIEQNGITWTKIGKPYALLMCQQNARMQYIENGVVGFFNKNDELVSVMMVGFQRQHGGDKNIKAMSLEDFQTQAMYFTRKNTNISEKIKHEATLEVDLNARNKASHELQAELLKLSPNIIAYQNSTFSNSVVNALYNNYFQENNKKPNIGELFDKVSMLIAYLTVDFDEKTVFQDRVMLYYYDAAALANITIEKALPEFFASNVPDTTQVQITADITSHARKIKEEMLKTFYATKYQAKVPKTAFDAINVFDAYYSINPEKILNLIRRKYPHKYSAAEVANLTPDEIERYKSELSDELSRSQKHKFDSWGKSCVNSAYMDGVPKSRIVYFKDPKDYQVYCIDILDVIKGNTQNPFTGSTLPNELLEEIFAYNELISETVEEEDIEIEVEDDDETILAPGLLRVIRKNIEACEKQMGGICQISSYSDKDPDTEEEEEAPPPLIKPSTVKDRPITKPSPHQPGFVDGAMTIEEATGGGSYYYDDDYGVEEVEVELDEGNDDDSEEVWGQIKKLLSSNVNRSFDMVKENANEKIIDFILNDYQKGESDDELFEMLEKASNAKKGKNQSKLQKMRNMMKGNFADDDKSGDKSSDKGGGKSNGKSSDKSSDKGGGKSSGKSGGDKSSDKGGGKSGNKKSRGKDNFADDKTCEYCQKPIDGDNCITTAKLSGGKDFYMANYCNCNCMDNDSTWPNKMARKRVDENP